jgi:hypothetical protein
VLKRFLAYALIGLAFGILDWYYLQVLARFPWGDLGESILVIPLILFLNYGIWLVVVVPVSIYEVRRSNHLGYTALAAVTVWSLAIFSYYLYYTLLLGFAGLPNMDHLLWVNREAPGFWQEWEAAFQRIILDQFLEWIVVAIVGGSMVGSISGYLYRKWGKKLSHP